MELPAVLALTLVACALLCHGAPTTNQQVDEDKAQEYLQMFFTESSRRSIIGRELNTQEFNDALKKMQEFFGLQVTGKLDTNTMEVMKKPRCGVTDVSNYGHFNGRPKWDKKLITYRITKYTPDLSQREVDATIARAFKLYSDVIPLDFQQVYRDPADIVILFQARNHGDFYPFDGMGGILAHAMSPGPNDGGDTHFDDDEQWTLSAAGINLLLVAAHEFGHALGLDHSNDRTALMFPTYSYTNTNGYQLPLDDRLGVQALYGVRQSPNPQPKPNPKPQPQPQPRPQPNPTERCNPDLVLDAVTSIRGELYFFKNDFYWKKSTLITGVPQTQIRSTWPFINSVDAVYELRGKNKNFFFKGQQVWGVRGTALLPGYPKHISHYGFPSSVTKIDAAVNVESTGRTLFFVGNKYWSYNELTEKMDSGFPKRIDTDFPGIGSKVDAAFENYGFLYFSDGAVQIEYKYQLKTINRKLRNYSWLNCY